MSKKVINISKDTSIEEVTSMLKNISTGVDIVFIYEDEVNVKKAKELGANEYMVKSNFTLDELAEKIKGLLK